MREREGLMDKAMCTKRQWTSTVSHGAQSAGEMTLREEYRLKKDEMSCLHYDDVRPLP